MFQLISNYFFVQAIYVFGKIQIEIKTNTFLYYSILYRAHIIWIYKKHFWS